jgi:hypothetical protein
MSRRNLALWVLAVTLAASASSSCGTDYGGHSYLALNESDRDVIVEVVTDQTRMLLLAAHTRGNLSASWSGPTDEWRLTVRGEGCAQLVSLTPKGQPTRLTLHVTPIGDIRLGAESVFSFEGRRVELVSPLPPANCG